MDPKIGVMETMAVLILIFFQESPYSLNLLFFKEAHMFEHVVPVGGPVWEDVKLFGGGGCLAEFGP